MKEFNKIKTATMYGIMNTPEHQKKVIDRLSRRIQKLKRKNNNFNIMKQYPIERSLFCKIFEKPYRILDENWDVVIDTDSFRYWYHDDEHYLVHLESGILINWYKHLGRCLTCNKDLTIKEYKYLAEVFYKELREEFKHDPNK